MRTRCVATLCVAVSVSAGAWAVATDPCQTPARSDPRVNLALRSAQLSEAGRFVGTFEISNTGFDHALVLSGKRLDGAFTIDVPEISVQFLDLNQEWVTFSTLAGDFIKPDRLEIAAHSRSAIAIDLMSQEEANRSASNFRVLLRFYRPDFCVISPSFHAIPSRQRVSGFEQDR
jgi:hypothetical protein